MATPQRESYTLPSSSSAQAGGVREAYQPSAYAAGVGLNDPMAVGSTGPAVQYICGECASKVQLTSSDAIRCKECGHRVLYKERTKR